MILLLLPRRPSALPSHASFSFEIIVASLGRDASFRMTLEAHRVAILRTMDNPMLRGGLLGTAETTPPRES